MPELWEELLKVVLHDYRERFIPDQGILYELWVPGGLTEPADTFIATWPSVGPQKEIRKAFDSVVRKYKSLSLLQFEDVVGHLNHTLAKRIRLQRHEIVSLSNKIRSNSELFSRFFEGVIVMKREHVDIRTAPNTAPSTDCSRGGIRHWAVGTGGRALQTQSWAKRQPHIDARLPEQFDAVIHMDDTRAVEPLERTALWETGEVPETYPTAL